MKRLDTTIIGLVQLCVILFVAHYQTIPGNIDADYYFMGGVRLAQGHGFTENYIWNYFNDPTSLPQPSNAYWMPLASMLTALGMWLTGAQTFASGRLAFILLAILIPPLTMALAYRITARRDLAIVSGLLAICSGFYLPYLAVTENYSLFMVLGALFFLNLNPDKKSSFLILGLITGLMSLARSDGMLWLLLIFLFLFVYFMRDKNPHLSKPKLVLALINFSLTLGGFLIIMLPWYLRNLSVFGSPMSTATRRAFWLTEYYQTFIYPTTQLTFQNWFASGWSSILAARLAALQRIASNIFTVQGLLILLPLMLWGGWQLRKDERIQWGLLAWAMLIFVFIVIFPFASVRGSYIHAVAVIQPLLWILAAVGIDQLVQVLRKLQAFQLKGIGLLIQTVFVLLAAFISYSSLNALIFTNGWQRGELTYPKVEQFLQQQNIPADEPIMIINPPGYTMMTGRPAVMFPYGGEQSILGVAKRFHAQYIALKEDPVNRDAHFNALFNNENLYASVQFVGQVEDVRIYKVIQMP